MAKGLGITTELFDAFKKLGLREIEINDLLKAYQGIKSADQLLGLLTKIQGELSDKNLLSALTKDLQDVNFGGKFFERGDKLVGAWTVLNNAPESLRKNTDVLEGISKLSAMKSPDVQKLLENGLTKTLIGASDADKINILSKLISWDLSKVDDLTRRLGDSKYSGLADKLSDPDYFKLYDEIINDPENAIDIAKQGGDAILELVI